MIEGAAADGADAGSALRILFVCTANRCRSPLAEAIARSQHSDPGYRFSSAGLLEGGYPVPETGVRTAFGLGLDLSAHVSHQVATADLANADLILTMTREQARELVARDPGAWPRIFLLTEVAGWLDRHPRPPGTPLAIWIREQGGSRSRSELLGAAGQGGIPDPMDRPPRVWRAVAAQLRTELDEIFARLRADRSTPSTP